MATRTKAPKGRSTDLTGYLELVRRHPLRPIRSEAELASAIAFLNALPHCDDLSAEEEDYKLVLADLIWRSESDKNPEPIVPHAEMLRALIDAKAITQAKLAVDLGIAESTVSEILSGNRGVSLRNRK